MNMIFSSYNNITIIFWYNLTELFDAHRGVFIVTLCFTGSQEILKLQTLGMEMLMLVGKVEIWWRFIKSLSIDSDLLLF